MLRSAHEVTETLAAARAELAARARRHGLRILASGAFPVRVERQPRVTPAPRYRSIAEHLGPRLFGQLVCGLHVHVGLGTRSRASNALEGVIPWLPDLLAVSVNSAFGDGDESALLSVRAARLAELEPTLLPPARCPQGAGDKVPGGWWDARYNERWGTLEVRVADQPTAVRRSGAIAALVQALVVTADQVANGHADRTTYELRRHGAARGMGRLDALATHLEPVARRFGTWTVIADLLRSETEGAHQRRVREADGRTALLKELLDASLGADGPRA